MRRQSARRFELSTQKGIKMRLFIITMLALTACGPTTPQPGLSSSGAGGGGSSTSSASGTGSGAPACMAPVHRSADYACTTAADCNTGTQLCEVFSCEKARCEYRRIEDGTHCDPGVPGPWHWSCSAGACCPRGDVGSATQP